MSVLTTAFLSLASVAFATVVNIPLSHQRFPSNALLQRPGRKFPSISTKVVVPETEDANFWFANFQVGAQQSLSMLIDTGSSDVYLNPGFYHPGASAEDQGRPFEISFATTNSDGTGSETLSGELWTDVVALGGLTSSTQELGNVTQSNVALPFPHDGLVGFAGQDESAFNGVPWFQNLCDQQSVDSCRFGLAFGTNGQGTQVLGGVDENYANDLATESTTGEWSTSMGIAVNGKTVQTKQPVIWDSGTSVIYGPLAQVKAIYKSLNIPTSQKTVQGISYLYGYYPCDKPPTVGFVLGGKTFNIVPSVWPAVQNGNNNCTAVLQGTDGFGSSWLVGQAFFQGRYIDHNIDAQTMGFANLD